MADSQRRERPGVGGQGSAPRLDGLSAAETQTGRPRLLPEWALVAKLPSYLGFAAGSVPGMGQEWI
jgi:hypothetical protein